MKTLFNPIPNLKIKLLILSTVCAVFFVLNWRITLPKYARSVQVETVQKKDLQLHILCPGLIVYKNAQELKAGITESVLKKNVKEGDLVQAGQVLLELSAVNQKLNLDKQTSRFKDAENEVTRAKKDYVVQKELYQKQAVALISVEKAQQDFEKSESNLYLIRQEFALEKKSFDRTKIVSPIAGTVLVDNVQNQPVVEQGKVVFIVGQPGQFQLDGKIDELNIQNVRSGATAEIVIDAFPNAKLQGVIEKINPQAETGSFSQLGVKINILDTQGLDLKANLSAQAYISGNEILQAIWMPVGAVKTEKETQFVFVVNAKNKVEKRKVSTGKVVYNYVEISTGLTPGEKAVLAEVDFLRDGETIKIK